MGFSNAMPAARTSPDDPSGRSVRVEVADPSDALPLAARRWLSERCVSAVGAVALAGEVRVRIIGDAEMAAAHQKHSGIDGTTDVLTFDLSDAPPGAPADLGSPSPRVLDADLLLCADEAARQAVRRGHPIEQELLLYCLHGALHCLGHDDHDPTRAELMHAVEDRVLAAIDVGATYNKHPGGAA